MPFDNRFSLYKLEVFCSVVETGGVGRAAEQLFVTQPVVSAHIRSLQEHVGARLFERDGRGVRLTQAGRTVYDWARDTLSGTRRLARALDDLDAGSRDSLVVAAGPSLASYVLPRVVCRLRVERPEARVGLEVAEPAQALASVRSGDADMAVLVRGSPAELVGFEADELGYEQLVLVTRPDRAVPEPIAPAQLSRLHLLTSSGDHLTASFLTDVLARAGFPAPADTTELGHPEAIKLAVAEGLGAAFLLRSAVDRELASGELCELPLAADLTVPVSAVHLRASRPSALHTDFLGAMADALAPVRVISLDRSAADAPQLSAA